MLRVRQTNTRRQDLLRVQAVLGENRVQKTPHHEARTCEERQGEAICALTSAPSARRRGLACEIVRPPSLSVA